MTNVATMDPRKAFNLFRELVRRHFRFVFDEYGFREADARMAHASMWMYLRNKTTQVAVHFEYSSTIWVTIGRLTTFKGKELGGEQYNIDHLLILRAPELVAEVKTMYDFDGVMADSILRAQAAALKLHATDILQGDFRVFKELKQIEAEAMAERLRTWGGEEIG
jgi:hypothetical protein